MEGEEGRETVWSWEESARGRRGGGGRLGSEGGR